MRTGAELFPVPLGAGTGTATWAFLNTSWSDTFFTFHLDGRREPLTVRAVGEVGVFDHADTFHLTPRRGRMPVFEPEDLRMR